MQDGLKWLFLEGAIPLLGAALLFWVWGGCRYLVCNDRSTFVYHWHGAWDPLGWLYGVMVVATQTGFRAYEKKAYAIELFCGLSSIACVFILIAAFTDRATNTSWQPNRDIKIAAGALIIANLVAGFYINSGALEPKAYLNSFKSIFLEEASNE